MLRSRITSLFAAMSLIAAVASAETPLHRSFNVAPGGTLTIDSDVGDIEVNPGAGGVSIDVFRRGRAAENVEVTFDQQGNDVTVRARYEHSSRWFNWNDGADARFVVTVPSRYNLHLNTSGGDIRVGSLQGEVRCRTSGGAIRTGQIDGPIEARTSGGDLSVDGATGRVDLRTSGGSIDVRHVGGDLNARTSGGGIAIEEALGAVNAQTSGGSIRARLAGQPRGDSRLATSGGSITVSLAPSVAVDLDAHTSGGGVDTDLPVLMVGHQSDSSVEGKINGGGPRLVLRSSGGGIRLRKM